MNSVIWTAIIWYSIPAFFCFVSIWWQTEIWMGNKWDDRLNILWISKAILVGTVWPIIAWHLAREYELNSRMLDSFRDVRRSRELWMKRYFNLKNTVTVTLPKDRSHAQTSFKCNLVFEKPEE